MSIWVCGEVLIDLIPGADGVRVGHVGGGPANTAKALARLGHEVQFIGQAPFGDPLCFTIDGTRLAIRKETAKQIE